MFRPSTSQANTATRSAKGSSSTQQQQQQPQQPQQQHVSTIPFLYRDVFEAYLTDLHLRTSPEIEARFLSWMNPAFQKGELILSNARIGSRTCVALAKLFSSTVPQQAHAQQFQNSNQTTISANGSTSVQNSYGVPSTPSSPEQQQLAPASIPALVVIDVRNNRIKDNGVTALAYAISPRTKSVFLDDNDITSQGAIALAKSLATLTASQGESFALDELSIANNPVGAHAISLLMESVCVLSWNVSHCSVVGEEQIVHAMAASLAVSTGPPPPSQALSSSSPMKNTAKSLSHNQRMMSPRSTLDGSPQQSHYGSSNGSSPPKKTGAQQISVQSLVARECGLCAPLALLIPKALEFNTALTVLDFRQNFLSDDFLAALAYAISQSGIPGLRVLNLSANRIMGDGVVVLVRSLQEKNLCLEYMDLSDNVLGDEAAIALSELPGCHELSLARCGVTAVAAEAFSQAAIEFASLQSESTQPPPCPYCDCSRDIPQLGNIHRLRLDGNGIRDAGAVSLARGLAHFSHLSLEDCKIGDEGALSLTLYALFSISLRGNHVTPIGGRIIAREIVRNPVIQTVDLKGNQLDLASLTVIQKHCEANRARKREREPKRLEREIARLNFIGDKLQLARDELTKVRKERQNEEGKVADDEDLMRMLRAEQESTRKQILETIEAEKKRTSQFNEKIVEKELEKKKVQDEIARDIEKLEKKYQEESEKRAEMEADFARRFEGGNAKLDLRAEYEAQLQNYAKMAEFYEKAIRDVQTQMSAAKKEKEAIQQAILNGGPTTKKPESAAASKSSKPSSGAKAGKSAPAPAPASKAAPAAAPAPKAATAKKAAEKPAEVKKPAAANTDGAKKPTPGMYPSTREESSSSLKNSARGSTTGS
ncbi:mitochondrial LRR_RI and DUF4200 domain-containing protein [Andalucia godoyi]|uniref:Mitochondrial LRR_RI and DUF4200 domain-containing protein n=1 Tax=Andalucia godoyi TaxID=505711 RepID=A0A8K0F429_ANDGO|nr:mitochondrial LRR_RI and DUF4200 domain-containing protein [Andalucia godoyi]|eukprot:ANDGO_08098.mRNA.1 mitochondrial LRR_RI and DUF4200 domain-containing protein